MDEVETQYEAFPYPERDPADEARRLIEGSPSHPAEIDHYLFGGKRDWSQPFKVLFAGGGTGDGLIMLAAKFADAGYPVEIDYLDLSSASLNVAKARAEARGLTSITFHKGSILNAPDLGQYDYIDCCGVLHHLASPEDGLKALRSALKDEGGLGGMVYAPLGRRGVYALQDAFSALFDDMPLADRLTPAKAVLSTLQGEHPFKQNPNVSDHKISDAGFVDLLLHSQDRAYSIGDLAELADAGGFEIVSLLEPALYRPELYLPAKADIRDRAKALPKLDQWALAENLNGNMKTHVFYLAPKGRGISLPSPSDLKLRPVIRGGDIHKLSKQVLAQGRLKTQFGNLSKTYQLPKAAGHILAHCDGRTLSEIASATGLPMLDFIQAWRPVHDVLTDANLLCYSDGFS